MKKPTMVAALFCLYVLQPSISQLNENLIMRLVEEAEDDHQEKKLMEEDLFRVQEQNDLQGHGRRPSSSASQQGEVSSVLEGTTYKLVNHLDAQGGTRKRRSSAGARQRTEDDLSVGPLSRVATSRIRRSGDASCRLESKGECDRTARYRTFSGRCNNLANPEFGATNSVLRRILPSEYDDNVSSPRSRDTAGFPLPNPRTVSLMVHTTELNPDPQHSLTTMQWGQFLDHDLAHVPVTPGHNLSMLQCKSCLSPLHHPACLPILIPSSETFFERFGPGQPLTCIPFTRSLGGQQTLGPREQINQITHYMDGSQVYGNDACSVNELRDHDNPAFLRSSQHPLTTAHLPLKPMLPFTRINPDCLAKDGDCFLAGDSRVNEQPGLTSLHTLFMREHNQVVDRLSTINPHWEAETLFQEARRIVVAIIQHITFSEFVPRVVGTAISDKFMLNTLASGYYYGYNSSCSGSIFSEFATAAFRFGHSMLRPNLTLMSNKEMEEGTGGRQLPLREVFKNPDMIKFNEESIDDVIRGLVMAPMESVDNQLTEEVTNHLFEKNNNKFSGMDLAAINIQRGRDHGMPGYNKYRQVCGLRKAASFSDLTKEVPEIIVGKLAALYNHPDDVDLFTGLLAEKKLSEGLVGPTLACLLALQFQNLRACDRYWYETGDPLLRFSPDQLTELRSQSMAGVLCRNCDSAAKMPPYSMDQPRKDEDNQLVSCDELGQLNLELWREESQPVMELL